MATPAEVVTDFIAAFTSGRVDRARALLSDDFTFEAPLMQRRGNAEQYFAGAEAKARRLQPARIVRQWADGGEVATIYDLEIRTAAGAGTLRMSEWHTVRDGRVASLVMIFNTASPAVGLMRDALRAGG